MRPVRELSILLRFMDRIMQVWTSLKSHLENSLFNPSWE